jgi:hypothetical protein
MKFYLEALIHNIPERKANKGIIFHFVLKARTVTMIMTREAKISLKGKFAPRLLYITASDMIKIV